MILKLFRGPIDSIRLATDDDVHVKSKKCQRSRHLLFSFHLLFSPGWNPHMSNEFPRYTYTGNRRRPT